MLRICAGPAGCRTVNKSDDGVGWPRSLKVVQEKPYHFCHKLSAFLVAWKSLPNKNTVWNLLETTCRPYIECPRCLTWALLKPQIESAERFIRDGESVATLMNLGKQLLGRRQACGQTKTRMFGNSKSANNCKRGQLFWNTVSLRDYDDLLKFSEICQPLLVQLLSFAIAYCLHVWFEQVLQLLQVKSKASIQFSVILQHCITNLFARLWKLLFLNLLLKTLKKSRFAASLDQVLPGVEKLIPDVQVPCADVRFVI